MVKCWVSVRLETAPTGVVEQASFDSLVSIKYLANEPLNGQFLKTYGKC